MQAEAGHWGSHRPGVPAETHPCCLRKPLPTAALYGPVGRALPRATGVPPLALGLAQGEACDPSWANGSAASPGPVIRPGRACDPSRANGSDSFWRERLLLTLVILHLLGRSSCLRPGTQERRPLLCSSPPWPRPLAPCFMVLIVNGIRMPTLQGCCQSPQTQDLSRGVENRAQQDSSPKFLLPAKSCRPFNKMAASQSEFSPQIPD